ncbi:MAG: helix-turn-helix domain-containing protein [Ktedonobacteraceae bacterium]
MTKKLVFSPSTSVEESTHELASPLLLHASSETGWDGLVVRAYREREIEQWAAPLVSTLTLVLVVSGTMSLEQRDLNGTWKGRHIRQGDLFLSPAGRAPYELRWQMLSDQPVQTLLQHLHADLVSRTAQELVGAATRQVTLAERVGFQDPLLLQIGLTLWREVEWQIPAGTLYLQAAAQLLAVHLLRHDTPVVENSQASTALLTRHQMQRVTDFILAHLGQDLSLELLAQQTGLSPYHFARVFRQTTGESPHQFVLQQRVALAQQLLRETDAPLAQVAQESGFASQSHLTDVFKRRFGLTPRVYRHHHEI